METVLIKSEVIQDSQNNTDMSELNELQLALIGGGSADVILA